MPTTFVLNYSRHQLINLLTAIESELFYGVDESASPEDQEIDQLYLEELEEMHEEIQKLVNNSGPGARRAAARRESAKKKRNP